MTVFLTQKLRCLSVRHAGQSCIAPDYVFVPTSLQKAFQQECVKVVKQFYADQPSTNPDFGRIVNERHTPRLAKPYAS
jgi:aldehyde dehydrogenase (NAD+)